MICPACKSENNNDRRNACAKSRIYKLFWHNRLQCQSYQRLGFSRVSVASVGLRAIVRRQPLQFRSPDDIRGIVQVHFPAFASLQPGYMLCSLMDKSTGFYKLTGG
jgi:hypothetical protein